MNDDTIQILEHDKYNELTGFQPIIASAPKFLNTDKPLLDVSNIFRFRKLANTREARRSALHFIKHGRYTFAPKGHPEYIKFWTEETRRCEEGYWVGDLFVPPKMYFYLNYIIIKKIPDADYLEIHPKAKKSQPVITFPSFWEIDFAWWNLVEYCEQQAELGNPFCHKVCVKTRQAGFSFKEAAEGVYNYTFYNDLISKYFAATEAYLINDGIFNKVEAMLNHLNMHTMWKQSRDVIDNKRHKKGSWIEAGTKNERGRRNELIAQVMDKPDKARGGNSVKITFEESGNNKYLRDAWMITLPQVKKGDITTGFMTAFGTGGTKEASYLAGLEEMFYNPEPFYAVPFNNIWDEGMNGTECGFFVPFHYTVETHFDKEGNVLIDKAQEYMDRDRAIMSKNSKFIQHKAENPMSPQEAFTRMNNSVFDKGLIGAQLLRVKNDKHIQDLLLVGSLYEKIDDNGTTSVQFMPKKKDKVDVIDEYPIERENLTARGSLVIEQPPYRDGLGQTPDDMYVVVFDPYVKDIAPESKSVGSVRVFKRPNMIDPRPSDKFVAWLDKRPKRKETLWDEILMLAEYYNAKIQFEIDGGGTNFFDYVKRAGKIHLLHEEPEMIHNKEIAGNQKNRSYGVRMGVGGRKDAFISDLADWTIMPIGLDGDGNEIRNIDRVYDIGLLSELQKYNDDGNFDRVSCACLGIMMRNEMEAIHLENKKADPNSFFNRALFRDDKSHSSLGMGRVFDSRGRKGSSIVERY